MLLNRLFEIKTLDMGLGKLEGTEHEFRRSWAGLGGIKKEALMKLFTAAFAAWRAGYSLPGNIGRLNRML